MLAAVADAHLGSSSGDYERFHTFLSHLLTYPLTHLLFLGDMFHYYIGLPSYDVFYDNRLWEKLRTFKKKGIEVIYLEGNRDFFIPHSPLASRVTLTARRWEGKIGTWKILAEHGDFFPSKNKRYRFFYYLSRSLPVRLAIQFLPKKIARTLLNSTEKTLKKTNKKFRYYVPEKELLAFAKNQASKYNLILLGHFHQGFGLKVGKTQLYALPAWQHREIWLLVEPDGKLRWKP